MGQTLDIPHDVPAADIPSQGESHFGLVLCELPGLDHVPDQHRRHLLVGHLDAHHGDLVRNGGDPHAGGPQGQGDIIRQVGDLAELHALVQHELIPGDGGAVDHVSGGGVHTEAGEGLRQAAGVVPQLCAGLSIVFLPALLQQGNGGELIGVRILRQLLLNLRGHRCRSGGYLLGHGLLPRRRGRRGGRRRGGGLRNGHLFRHGRRGGSGLGAGRRRRRFQRRLLRLLVGEHLVRRLHLVGLMPEEAGKPAGLFLRLCGRLLAVQGNVDGGPALALSPPLGRLRRSDVDGGRRLRLLLVLRPVPYHLQNGGRRHMQGRQQQNRQQQAEEEERHHLGDRQHRRLRQQAGNGAARLQGKARRPEILQNAPAVQRIVSPCENGVEQRSCQQRQQQGAGGPQGDRAAPVQQQDPSCQQHGRAGQPVAVAEQSLQELGQQVDEDRLHAAVAHQHTQRQHQQYHAPHLPADGTLLRLLTLGRA